MSPIRSAELVAQFRGDARDFDRTSDRVDRAIDALVRRSRLLDTISPDVEVGADTADAISDLRRTGTAAEVLDALSPNVDVDSQVGGALAGMGRASAAAQAVDALSPDIEVEADTSRAVAELGFLRKAFDGIRLEARAGASSMTKSFSRIGVAATGAGAAIIGAGAAFGGLIGLGVKTNATLETASLQFETLMGSADKAREHVEGLFAFAKATPFETAPIIEASRIMQTFGGDALNTEENLRLVGDAAAATSSGIEEVGFWVARAYADIQAGRPFGEAAARLSELGVITPQARNEIEKLAAEGGNADAVFAQLQGELGRFDGAMIKMATTWAGVTSSLADTAQLGAQEMTAPLFESLKNLGLELLAFSETPAWDRILERGRGVFEGIAANVDRITQAFSAGGPGAALDEMSTMIRDAFDRIDVSALGDKLIGALTSAAQRVGEWLPGLIDSLATGIQGMDWGRISQLFSETFTTIMAGVDWAAVSEAAVTFIVEQAPRIIQGFIEGIIRAAVANPLDFGAFLLSIGFVPARMLGSLAGILGRIPLVGKLVEWLLRAFGSVGRAIVDPIKSVGGKIITGLLGGLTARFPGVAGFLASIPGRVTGALRGAPSWLIGKGREAIGGLLGGITARFPGVMGFLGSIPGRVIGALRGAASWLYQLGKDILQGLINGAKAMVGRVADAVLAPIRSAVDGAKRLLGIGSPSRLFAGFGANIGEGLVEGILGGTSRVARAADRLAQASVPTFADPQLSRSAASSRAESAVGSAGRAGDTVINVYLQGPLVGESGLRDLARKLGEVTGGRVRMRGAA
ncbi:MAG: hypothetical protein M3P85_02025 [Actinomycetota bacterium]|nr:hypothetical protein [Actinomycetota bacterium]